MARNERHGRARYRAGCGCELCKCAEAEYQRARRQRISEAVGSFAVNASPDRQVLSENTLRRLTSVNTGNDPANISGTVESAVFLEIEGLGDHPRPGLAATALALARILDNPKAVSTQPAAAAALMNVLGALRKGAAGAKPKLATVRQMTRSGH